MNTKCDPRQSVDLDRIQRDHPARIGTGTQLLVGLAMDFAGQAADAVGLVVAKLVLAHPATPSGVRRVTRTTVSVSAAATAGGIEVVELAVLQALVGDAEAAGRAWRAAPWRRSRAT